MSLVANAMLFILFTAALAPARAHMAAGEKAYDDYDFPSAIMHLRATLDDPANKDGLARQKARCLLAFSLFLSQPSKPAEAGAELRRLFAENLDYALNEETTHPELLRFFRSERAAYKASLTEVKTIGDRHPWLRIIPAGVGHFMNHDFVAGGSFLGVEIALVATNVTAGILRARMRDTDGQFFEGTRPIALQYVMNFAAFSAIAVAVIEIIDAFVWSPARGRASLARSMRPEVTLGALGTYRISFAIE